MGPALWKGKEGAPHHGNETPRADAEAFRAQLLGSELPRRNPAEAHLPGLDSLRIFTMCWLLC